MAENRISERQRGHLDRNNAARHAVLTDKLIRRLRVLVIQGQDPGERSMKEMTAEAGISTASYYRHRDEWTWENLKSSLDESLLRRLSSQPEPATRPRDVMTMFMITGYPGTTLDDVEVARSMMHPAMAADPLDFFSADPARVRHVGSEYMFTPAVAYLRWTEAQLRLMSQKATEDAEWEHITNTAADAWTRTWDAMTQAHIDPQAFLTGQPPYHFSIAQMTDQHLGAIIEQWANASAHDPQATDITAWLRRHDIDTAWDDHRTRLAFIKGILSQRDAQRGTTTTSAALPDRNPSARDRQAAERALQQCARQPMYWEDQTSWTMLQAQVWLVSHQYDWFPPLSARQGIPTQIERRLGANVAQVWKEANQEPIAFALAMSWAQTTARQTEGRNHLLALLSRYLEHDPTAAPPNWSAMPPTAVSAAISFLVKGTVVQRAKAIEWLEVIQMLKHSADWQHLPQRSQRALTRLLRDNRSHRPPLVASTLLRRSQDAETPNKAVGRIHAEARSLRDLLASGAVLTWVDYERLQETRHLLEEATHIANAGELLGQQIQGFEPADRRILVPPHVGPREDPQFEKPGTPLHRGRPGHDM